MGKLVEMGWIVQEVEPSRLPEFWGHPALKDLTSTKHVRSSNELGLLQSGLGWRQTETQTRIGPPSFVILGSLHDSMHGWQH